MTRTLAFQIVRPGERHWQGILAVLKTANFHHIGSSEVPELPLKDCFVALVGQAVVGVASYRFISENVAETILLAVKPRWRGTGIGEALQVARLNYMKSRGVKTIYTDTDDPRVVRWACRKFGFKPTGKLTPKTALFGRTDVDHWINLVLEV